MQCAQIKMILRYWLLFQSGVEDTVLPFDSCLSVQKADVGKTCEGREPNIGLIYRKTTSQILHTDLSIAKHVNVMLLTCYSGGYFLTLLP